MHVGVNLNKTGNVRIT